MPTLSPVDYDPFAQQAKGAAGVTLTPVDHDPFEQPNVAVDAVKALPDAIANRYAGGIGMMPAGLAEAPVGDMSLMTPQGAAPVKKLIEDTTGPLYKAKTPEGRIYSDTASAVFDPTSYLGPFGPARSVGSSAAASFFGDTAGEATGSPTAAIAASLLSPTFAKSAITAPKIAAPLDTVLRAEGGAGSQAVRDMQFATDGKVSNQFINDTLNDFNKRNLDLTPSGAPGQTTSILQSYANKPFMTAKDYDALKLRLNAVEDNPAARATATGALYDHVNGLTPQNALIGDTAKFKGVFNEARDNYSAGMRGKTIEDALQNAQDNAAAKNSGRNVGNDINTSLKPLTKNRDEKAIRSGFNADEIAALRKITNLTLGTKLIREVGNRLGGGGGIASTHIAGLGGAIGAAAGGYEGAGEGTLGGIGLAALGALARGRYNSMQLSRANALSEMVRARSPLAKSMGVTTPQARAWMQSILKASNQKRVLNAVQVGSGS